MSARYGISQQQAGRLLLKFRRRQRRRGFRDAWLIKLMDAQFETHIGRHPRVRCGRKTHLSHLTPDRGEYCHDCGCARGEFHVFSCDAEECSNCGGQAFCCECDPTLPDGLVRLPRPSSNPALRPRPHLPVRRAQAPLPLPELPGRLPGRVTRCTWCRPTR